MVHSINTQCNAIDQSSSGKKSEESTSSACSKKATGEAPGGVEGGVFQAYCWLGMGVRTIESFTKQDCPGCRREGPGLWQGGGCSAQKACRRDSWKGETSRGDSRWNLGRRERCCMVKQMCAVRLICASARKKKTIVRKEAKSSFSESLVLKRFCTALRSVFEYRRTLMSSSRCDTNDSDWHCSGLTVVKRLGYAN